MSSSEAEVFAAPPLSYSQKRMWFLNKLGGGVAYYNVAFQLHLQGPLDKSGIESALDTIVARHSALRTRCVDLSGEPRQVVVAEMHCHLPVFDLIGLTSETQEEQIRDFALDEATRPFDLTVGCLLRTALIRLSDEQHVLVITVHHVAADGWSMVLLFREITECYGAFVKGISPSLPELEWDYGRFSEWQHHQLASGYLNGELAYWKNQLAGVEPIELPYARQTGSVRQREGRKFRFQVEKPNAWKDNALGRQENATPFMVLLTAFNVLLYRHTNQTDIAIGSLIAGRHLPQITNLIGFFANTVVLRTDLSGEPSFREMLRRVRKVALDAYDNQNLPFEVLVEKLAPVRTIGEIPFVRVMFVMQQPIDARSEMGGLNVSRERVDTGDSEFDLSFEITDAGSHWEASIDYNTAVFKHQEVQEFGERFCRVLEGALEMPDISINVLPILSTDERHDLLYSRNETQVPFPSDRCVHQLFEQQAAQYPRMRAVVYEDQELSYEGLNIRANQLSHYLRKLGVGPEVLVAICLERSAEMIVALLAVLKAGGAYVPVDAAYPLDRISFMLEDSRPAALLTQTHLRDRLCSAAPGLPVLAIDSDEPYWSNEPSTNPSASDIGLTSRNLAYVIYTSGSTGKPKGVLVEHRSLINLISWHATEFSLGPGQSTTSLASFGFGAATWEIWPPISFGATLILPRFMSSYDPRKLIDLWRQSGLRISFLPTSLAELVLAESNDIPLELLLIGGDRLRSFPSSVGKLKIINNYGSTETTVVATSGPFNPSVPSSIGRPLANTKVYILDPGKEPVPVGIIGELYVGGESVARGYLNRQSLTEERFLPDPFISAPSSRMYKTGDLGRWLDDGSIEFLGRNDFQVKIRGFRIELGEIEAQLADFPGVAQAAVVALEDPGNEKRLFAYYTTDFAEEVIDVELLQKHLAQVLPEYMIPAGYIRLDKFPLSPNGKLNRRALPDPDHAAYAKPAFAAPATPTEMVVAAIWADLLRVDRIGRFDNFFTLGGHSLLAVRVTARFRQELGVEVAIRDIFAFPILADLSRVIQEVAAAKIDPIVPHRPLPRTFRTPTTLTAVSAEGKRILSVDGGLSWRDALTGAKIE
jgi:amino acid adenylation domain-containing protein